MDKLDIKIKEALNKKTDAPKNHPDLSELSVFLESGFGEDEMEKLRQHLAECEQCRELVRINLALMEDEPDRVPATALKRVKALFQPSLLQRLAGAARGLFKDDSGEAFPVLAPAFAVRGKGLALSQGLSSYTKELNGWQTEIEVEPFSGKLYQIVIWLYDKQTRQSVSGVRASVCESGRELESLLIEKGRAVFEAIPAGEYTVEFKHEGKLLSGIAIKIKGTE